MLSLRERSRKEPEPPESSEGVPAGAGSLAAEIMTGAGRRIREARLSREMSIKDLAFAAGINPGFLSYIETGRKAPSLTTLVKLAEALGVALPRLFGASSRKPSSGERCLGAFMRVVLWSGRKERALLHEILNAYAKALRGRTAEERERVLKGALALLRGLG